MVDHIRRPDGTHVFALGHHGTVELDDIEYRNFNSVRGQWRGDDAQTLLLNYKKYGVFRPTPEDFARYRAAAEAVGADVSTPAADVKTGYENASLAEIGTLLDSMIHGSLRDEVKRRVLTEVKRRLATASIGGVARGSRTGMEKTVDDEIINAVVKALAKDKGWDESTIRGLPLVEELTFRLKSKPAHTEVEPSDEVQVNARRVRDLLEQGERIERQMDEKRKAIADADLTIKLREALLSEMQKSVERLSARIAALKEELPTKITAGGRSLEL